MDHCTKQLNGPWQDDFKLVVAFRIQCNPTLYQKVHSGSLA